MLGSSFVIFNLNFTNGRLKAFGMNNLLKEKDKNPLLNNPRELWPLIAAMICCYHMSRVPGVTFVTVFKKILPGLSSVNVGELAEQMKVVSKKTPAHYESKLLQLSSLFSHAPVLSMEIWFH